MNFTRTFLGQFTPAMAGKRCPTRLSHQLSCFPNPIFQVLSPTEAPMNQKLIRPKYVWAPSDPPSLTKVWLLAQFFSLLAFCKWEMSWNQANSPFEIDFTQCKLHRALPEPTIKKNPEKCASGHTKIMQEKLRGLGIMRLMRSCCPMPVTSTGSTSTWWTTKKPVS